MSTRDEFEKFAQDHGLKITLAAGDNQCYAFGMTRLAWDIWQASRAAALKESMKAAESARDKMHSYHMPMQAAGAEVVCQEIRALANPEGA